MTAHKKINVLIVGGGGREHALAYCAAQSPLAARVYVAPGNAGTALEARVENIDIRVEAIDQLADFAEHQAVGLTIVGPETPLVHGIADEFARRGLKCFAPSSNAAQLEGSKTFAKQFFTRHNIPTAAWQSFRAPERIAAHAYIDQLGGRCVVKVDGLAGGKGVCVAEDASQARAAVDAALDDSNDDAQVVIEEFLHGEEASFICMVGRGNIAPLASSQDHKAAEDGDRGANTGGMGAVSPTPLVDDAMHEKIMRTIIRPTVEGLADEGAPYCGFLYAGVMIDARGAVKVLEFNCRLGDPEAQVILLRLRSDLIAHCCAATSGDLSTESFQWDARNALGVVIAARGYPHAPELGAVIDGLDAVRKTDEAFDEVPDVMQTDSTKVFYAGVECADGQVRVAGGRVVCATALAVDAQSAQRAAYKLAGRIHWRGAWHRNDIGHRAIARQQSNCAPSTRRAG